MRILQLIAQSKIGGAESVGFTLAAEFARRGHRTLLLSNRSNGPLLERPRPDGMTAAQLTRSNRLDPRILNFLMGHTARFRPQVIHAHNYEAMVWGRFLGLLHPRVAVIGHVHSSGFIHQHGARRILSDRLLHRRSDAILTLNEEQTRFLETVVRVRANALHLVPNGIDTRRFAPPGDAARVPRTAVCVASLIPVKNHAGLLRAWKRVAAELPESTLVLVGDGPLRPELERQAREHGLDGRVRFAGLNDDVRPFLWGARLFVLFSSREALPLAVLEGMAAGCVPVVPAVGGLPDVIQDGVTGRLVPALDEDRLAEILIETLRDESGAEALAARARAEVEGRFGLSAWLDRIEEIYRAALARRGWRDASGATRRS